MAVMPTTKTRATQSPEGCKGARGLGPARRGGLEGPRKQKQAFHQVRPAWHPDATFVRSRSKLEKHLD